MAYIKETHEVSERRACSILGATRALVRYRFTRAPDTQLRERLKTLAAERRRFGYRRLAVLLRREGFADNIKKIRRIYREENLTVKRRKGRKKALGTRAPLPKAGSINQVWSLDFMSDALIDGRRFRVLEHFAIKWKPVNRNKMRQKKYLDHFFDSTYPKNGLIPTH